MFFIPVGLTNFVNYSYIYIFVKNKYIYIFFFNFFSNGEFNENKNNCLESVPGANCDTPPHKIHTALLSVIKQGNGGTPNLTGGGVPLLLVVK